VLERDHELDRARRPAGLLAGQDLAVDVLLLDQQRAVADVPPLSASASSGRTPAYARTPTSVA
jgi:hypothetical protein